MRSANLLALLSVVSAVTAYTVPDYLSEFYSTVENGGCKSYVKGNNRLKDGQGGKGWGYCDDTPGIVYLTGKNELGDMDIDCDGLKNCGDAKSKTSSEDQISALSFDETLQTYASSMGTTPAKNYSYKSFDASIIPFVVLGTVKVPIDTPSGGPIEPLSIVAVVCNNQLFYGIYADTNGSDNSNDNFTGEASLALGKICFPEEKIDGRNGHVEHDVLYVAFTGKEAVPGAKGANWEAKTTEEFQDSIKMLGDKLVAKSFNNETVASWRTKESEIESAGGRTYESKIWLRVLGATSIGWLLNFW